MNKFVIEIVLKSDFRVTLFEFAKVFAWTSEVIKTLYSLVKLILYFIELLLQCWL